MNRGITLSLLVAVFAMVFAGCGNNKEAEKKIAALESRLAEIEGGNTATSTAQPAQPEQKPEGPLPAFKFEAESHDFGTINEGEKVSHTFKFTNEGEAPLIIQNAQGSCGCTVPTWPKEPIPVGGTGEITAEFNSKGMKNLQTKTVTITANTWPKKKVLRIKAQVTPKAADAPAK